MDERSEQSRSKGTEVELKPSPIISRRRWTARAGSPRLVTLPWSGIAVKTR